jgi:hypothetical protein
VRTRGRRIGALRWVNELKEKAPVILVCRGSADGLFPLTPALSPEERESRRQRLSEFEALRLAARRCAILPLPRGEVRGEGERDAGMGQTLGLCKLLRVK